MKQIEYFNTRIIRDNEVFLLAEDVAAALGYSDVKLFLSKHNDIINTTNAILPALVKENDFNSILLSNKDVLQHIGHIEITKVDTLRSHTEAIKSFYPLKYMLEGKVLEYRAADAGYKSVSEYLDKVELPGLLTHLLKRKHYVAAKYIDNIPEIIRKPDYIGTYNSSIEFVKCYKDNIFISVKLDTKRNKYYVATAYEVKQGKIESYVKSGRLNKVGINVLD